MNRRRIVWIVPWAFVSGTAVVGAPAGTEPAPVRVAYVVEGVAGRPDEAAWEKVPETRLALAPQGIVPPIGGGSVREVSVRAMHDGKEIAIRLEWADATADKVVGVDRFRDSAAVGFPLGASEPPPSPFMGDPQHPVAIWQWTADLEAAAAGYGGFDHDYPQVDGVWYFPQDVELRRQVLAWRGSDPVMEFVAAGFGSLSRREGRAVRGASAYREGRWQVVLRRSLAAGHGDAVAFQPGERTRLVVAIWDGARGEVNGRKSVTMQWVPFELETTVKAASPEADP
jgi:hypothetical protein